ncbi:Crp/Fnr family transcriptional regulator [Clostridium malenominatum]|uniref:Crp/Fnr family transcriptional regulator n=1 Tax=Clostridium malenominatum TaxID=1539 RepID=A0ABP3UAK3_9CLOT
MHIEKYFKIINAVPLFKGLTEEDILKTFKREHYDIKEYGKNNIVYLQNQECKTVDIILRGEVLVQKIEANGNILTINTFEVGDTLGSNLIFASKKAYPMTVITKSNCTLLHIDSKLVLKLCQRDEIFLIKFLQNISDRTVFLTDKIKSIALKTIRQCIIDYLIYQYYQQKSLKVKLDMSKKDLAEKLGVQRPSLSRELRKMRDEGLIDFDAYSITIKDANILK